MKWRPRRGALAKMGTKKRPFQFWKGRGIPGSQAERLERFHNCSTPKPPLTSAFFLKKKAPSTALQRASELWNSSSGGSVHVHVPGRSAGRIRDRSGLAGQRSGRHQRASSRGPNIHWPYSPRPRHIRLQGKAEHRPPVRAHKFQIRPLALSSLPVPPRRLPPLHPTSNSACCP